MLRISVLLFLTGEGKTLVLHVSSDKFSNRFFIVGAGSGDYYSSDGRESVSDLLDVMLEHF